MHDAALAQQVKLLGELLYEEDSSLAFTILEIGAVPLEGETEPFHQLLDIFPESKIFAFEVDSELCADLNRKAKEGLKYYPVALGRTQERRAFYETNQPMCCSLYEPNEKLISMYHNMDVAMLKSVSSIETVSVDYFMEENNIKSVDFIKIDIQGAELDVFQGGAIALGQAVAIVSEVEFVPHYIDQPLFGDVCAFLSEKGFMFHKFLTMSGRSLKPIAIDNNPNYPAQHMWSDAMYIRHIYKIPELSPQDCLKLGLLSFMYKSPDVTFQCLKSYDKRKGTRLREWLTGPRGG